jgi:hypothetical protein
MLLMLANAAHLCGDVTTLDVVAASFYIPLLLLHADASR